MNKLPNNPIISSDPRLDELAKNFKMPEPIEGGFIPTLNAGGGYMMNRLDALCEAFVDFASSCTHPILEIGTAYGISTLPALEKSSCPVIANDISLENLLILRNLCPAEYRHRLYLHEARFPDELILDNHSLQAVAICRVVHFLTGEVITRGLQKIHDWLIPGGKLFLTSSTPYLSTLKDFLPIYEKRWAEGIEWPGVVDNYRARTPLVNLPDYLHVMDDRPLRKALEKIGFIIESFEYLDRREYASMIALDGREGIGVIARKKS